MGRMTSCVSTLAQWHRGREYGLGAAATRGQLVPIPALSAHLYLLRSEPSSPEPPSPLWTAILS